MTADFVILTPQKPAYGLPCNGCGHCCQAQPCALALDLIGADIRCPCPALEWHGDRYRCGLVLRPNHYIPGLAEKPWVNGMLSATFRAMLGVGCGCDSD